MGTADDAAGDPGLLRAYEPVLRFTAGELFLPMAVAPYVAQCSLWASQPEEASVPVVPAGQLTLVRLAEVGERFRDRPLYLRFVQQPLTRREVRAWRREDRPRLRGTSRFAAVGVLSRLIDLALRLSLLVRGRVPGGLVAAAHRASRADPDPETRPYYGRVVRDGGYTVLQYWYFYAFNDWRSTFYGVNDHEADWELVAVYLVDEGDGLRAAWVAASSHDHHGDVLRRRWDDVNLRREGTHPVVFPGAGSHSGAFVPADYIVSAELPALRRAFDRLRWRPRRSTEGPSAFAIPFVDYARGDGPAIGPGHPCGWRLELIDEETRWVHAYRGLWGLDTRDAFGGERAPAGPRYERSGLVRLSWTDPLRWAGLDTVPPTAAVRTAALQTRLDALTERQRVLDRAIGEQRAALRELRAQADSLGASADIPQLQRERLAELTRRDADLGMLVDERTRLVCERDAHAAFLARPTDAGAPDAHLRRVHLPQPVRRPNAFLRVWAAISTPVLIMGIGLLLFRPTPVTLSGVTTFLVIFAGVEAVARRRVPLFLAALLVTVVGVSAVAGLVVAALRNAPLVLAAALAAVAVLLLALNMRELVGRPATVRGLRPGRVRKPARPGSARGSE